MTEEEAGAKWCPFARGASEGNRMPYGAGDGPVDPQYGAEMAALYPCIASSCMAWQWSGTYHAYPVDTQCRTDPLDVDDRLLQRD